MNELAQNIDNLEIGEDNSFNNSHEVLFYRKKLCWKLRDFETIRNNLVHYQNQNNYEYEGRIFLFNSHNLSVEEIAKFNNSYLPYQVATTQNKVNSYVRYSK